MASNMFKKYTEAKVRTWNVGTAVPAGTVVIDAESGEVGVTLAASGGSTETITLPDGSTLTRANAGVGYASGEAQVAVDGSWLLTVAGVANGETVPDSAAGTNRGTPVYRVTATGAYSLTSTDAVRIGIIDAGRIVGGVAPVLIGV
jgi:hypothetical protein